VSPAESLEAPDVGFDPLDALVGSRIRPERRMATLVVDERRQRHCRLEELP
jgi:hypothetical protein